MQLIRPGFQSPKREGPGFFDLAWVVDRSIERVSYPESDAPAGEVAVKSLSSVQLERNLY